MSLAFFKSALHCKLKFVTLMNINNPANPAMNIRTAASRGRYRQAGVTSLLQLFCLLPSPLLFFTTFPISLLNLFHASLISLKYLYISWQDTWTALEIQISPYSSRYCQRVEDPLHVEVVGLRSHCCGMQFFWIGSSGFNLVASSFDRRTAIRSFTCLIHFVILTWSVALNIFLVLL